MFKAPVTVAPRLGQLCLPERAPIATPTFFACTSRGALPHLAPDNLAKHVPSLSGVYLALEDFVEKKQPPLFDFVRQMRQTRPGDSSPHITPPDTAQPQAYTSDVHYTTPSQPLHRFLGLPDHVATILALRRNPAVPAPLGNGKKHVTIFTSTGFADYTTAAYAEAVGLLRPNIVIPMSDTPVRPASDKAAVEKTVTATDLAEKAVANADPHATATPTPTDTTADTPHRVTNPSKRVMKMVHRTEDWVSDFVQRFPRAQRDIPTANQDPTAKADGSPPSPSQMAVFAPVLPATREVQWEYLERLSGELAGEIDGLALHDAAIVPDLAHYSPTLQQLPRLSLQGPSTPQDILRQVLLGIDICTVPFLNGASDAGVALTFRFPVPQSDSHSRDVQPLGLDLWSDEHDVAVEPLVEGCPCYTCTRHHRAYIRHLLNANEMLSWTLLQIHNYHVLSEFFHGIRMVLAGCTESPTAFHEACQQFTDAYEAQLPAGTGTRPRVRGYHFKSTASQPKANPPGWRDLEST